MKEMIERNWDVMASDYENFSEALDSFSNAIEWPCIRVLLPPLEGRSIIDIGCGTGRFSFYFDAYQPRHILGIDLSGAMIDLANGKNDSERIAFKKADIIELTDHISTKFDFAFSSTTAHYFSDLYESFKTVHDILVTEGVFILSVIHPIYSAMYPLCPDDSDQLRYLDRSERRYIQPWTRANDKMDVSLSYHHTFSDYINALTRAGFEIMQVEEPRPPESWQVSNQKRYDALIKEPLYMIIRCRKW
ncbi:MAG: class I SAM-dependent methyltransferase [Clostridia bacterium]|nr:class I SAM-dependent methyltransferase [Clostridia bacterium]